MRKFKPALLAAIDYRFRDAAHITLHGWIWQLIFMIGHSPSTARAKMPLPAESDFFGEVQSHVDRRDQWLGITEVRALMKVNPFEREIVLVAEFRGFEHLVACHTEFAIVLSCLGMGMMCVD